MKFLLLLSLSLVLFCSHKVVTQIRQFGYKEEIPDNYKVIKIDTIYQNNGCRLKQATVIKKF